MDQEEIRERLERLERTLLVLARRLERLEETVSSIELEVRQLNEAEDLGVTQ